MLQSENLNPKPDNGERCYCLDNTYHRWDSKSYRPSKESTQQTGIDLNSLNIVPHSGNILVVQRSRRRSMSLNHSNQHHNIGHLEGSNFQDCFGIHQSLIDRSFDELRPSELSKFLRAGLLEA